MSLLKIRYYPDAVLKAKAKKITIFDSSVRKLAQDMLDTMYENDGVGLAAPQVGVSKRLMVIDVSGEEETPRPIVFINPEIIERDGEMTGQEGCLSFPDVFFEVKRASKVVVKFQNLKGQTLKLTADGNLLSRAIQHEIDHLDGELFIDRAVSQLKADLEMTKAGFREGDVAELERELELEKEAHTISLTQTANQPVAL
ncbi:MAG: peptide deformylase [Cyanobacteria bacterium PR.023]|jgi:peptide deformylase|nr:peptide deformylase [Cyanobacteria bacterium PR.023]MDQ5934808.1 peptide deformylase [Cyanobacteriota bacterium erpe_2018_sw_21hr_WHONDRS-SW48-000092_B_bin.40]